MRYIGILIMAGAVIGGGFLAAASWRDRLELLLLFRQMIHHLKGQILSVNATLPEALAEVGGRFSRDREGIFQEPGMFFVRVSERLEKGEGGSFGVVWREEMKHFPSGFPLGRADLENLQTMGENLGYADRAMQERTLLFYLEQTDDSIGILKEKMEERTKLCRCLGMAAGLFLMVILA